MSGADDGDMAVEWCCTILMKDGRDKDKDEEVMTSS